jgi:hypothetical protein
VKGKKEEERRRRSRGSAVVGGRTRSWMYWYRPQSLRDIRPRYLSIAWPNIEVFLFLFLFGIYLS